MEAITAFLESFDIAKLLPDLGLLISNMRLWASLFLLIGPIIMLILGAWYFFLPAREANHHIGFRTYFTMGSVAVWKYSQRLAGLYYMIGGGALAALSILLVVILSFLEPMAMATVCFIMIIVQVAAVLALWIFLQVLILRKFDLNGNPK